MKKKEIKILAVFIVLIAIGFLVVKNPFKKKEPDVIVAVRYRDQIVQEFDPSVDAVYTLEGSYGHVEVEVKDNKWRITNEECPNHVCSSMGWVDASESIPIVCMPNEVIVMVIKNGDK